MLKVIGTLTSMPGVMPGWRWASKWPLTWTGSPSCAPGCMTPRPSSSMSRSAKEIFSPVSCHGTWKIATTAQGVASGPQVDQPPPEMNSLPSATWA
jgi:hypothetical protein